MPGSTRHYRHSLDDNTCAHISEKKKLFLFFLFGLTRRTDVASRSNRYRSEEHEEEGEEEVK